jgi:CheY-specific phosphatase CheX
MITPEEWLDAIAKSLNEVADSYLDVSSAPLAEYDDDPDSPKAGAVIGLVSDTNSVQMQLLSTEEGAESLARALLGFDFDEPIESDDMSDAIAEIMNIVGGLVKIKLHDKDPGLNLTLPMFLDDKLKGLGERAVNSRLLEIGPVATKIVTVNAATKSA